MPQYRAAAVQAGADGFLAKSKWGTQSDVNIGVVTALVDGEGQVYGVMGADITLVNLTQYLSGFQVGHGGQILLLDQIGTILVSKDETLHLSLSPNS